MKKLLFSALACVAFAFSGFASNEEVEVKNEIDNSSFDVSTISDFKEDSFGSCVITVTVYDSKGNVTDTRLYFRTATSQSDCNAKGYELVKQLTPYISSDGKLPGLFY